MAFQCYKNRYTIFSDKGKSKRLLVTTYTAFLVMVFHALINCQRLSIQFKAKKQGQEMTEG